MLPKVVLVSLLSLVLVLSAAGLECRIYVSSSDGINNTSCWTGGLQTPCATIDLAIQGTPTLQYNCSSGILINLSPGTYTLDTTSLLEQQVLRNNVSIIGMRDGSRYEEVSITCLHVSSSSYNWLRYIVFQCVSLYNCNNVPVTCTEPSFDLTTHNANAALLCPNLTLDISIQSISGVLELICDNSEEPSCTCGYFYLTAYINDTCNDKRFEWEYNLKICIFANFLSVPYCYILERYYYGAYIPCYDNYTNTGPFEVFLSIQTVDLININTSITVNIKTRSRSTFTSSNECSESGDFYIPFTYYYYEGNDYYFYSYYHNYTNNYRYYDYYYYYYYDYNYNYSDYYCNYICNNNYECCFDKNTSQCLIICTSGTGVPINNLACINCTQYSHHGFALFIGLELIPMTLMVIVIIIFNIQLTNGSINAVVFYSQLIAIIYSINGLNSSRIKFYFAVLQHLSAIPCYIFNLDFTPFLFNYPLCITDNMSPLWEISFWYVIGFYPLLLLLLLYIWMTLYDKGFKCVVFITRPFHRCMARFWSMTGIEPSFTHSIASIYILCFTQLTATSFKILSFDPLQAKFAFDKKQGYFQGWHGLAGSIAIIVLLFLIILPTLCILFYRFKWFQKLLDCLHLRKPLLITLADVFTGPYKNGTENTFDYRFMPGLYLLARIIILSQFIIGYQYYVFAVPIALSISSFLLSAVVLIFRPFKKNIHNFTEFCTLFLIAVLSSVAILFFYVFTIVVLSFNILVFGIIISIYIIYKLCKIIKACHYYHKKRAPVIPTEQEYEEDVISLEDNWVADRMENPQQYNERHVSVTSDDLLPENKQPVITTAVEELKRPLLDTQN